MLALRSYTGWPVYMTLLAHLAFKLHGENTNAHIHNSYNVIVVVKFKNDIGKTVSSRIKSPTIFHAKSPNEYQEVVLFCSKPLIEADSAVMFAL